MIKNTEPPITAIDDSEFDQYDINKNREFAKDLYVGKDRSDLNHSFINFQTRFVEDSEARDILNIIFKIVAWMHNFIAASLR